MGKEISDEDLMMNYRSGEATAFDTLYRRHKGGIYRYLLKKCGSESVAEELFQDVWMKLIAAREHYEVKAKFTTFLYQLAHNRFIDHYRRQKTTMSMNLVQNDCNEESIPGRIQEQPETKVYLSEQIDIIFQLLDELPDEQREVFMLKEEAGMSIAEIADVIGVNQETTKSRLRYAIKKLRTGLSENE